MAASASASGSREKRAAPRRRRRRSSVADAAAVAASSSGRRANTSITPSLCTVSDRTSRPAVTASTSTRHTTSIALCPGPESSGITAVSAASADPGLPVPLRSLALTGCAAGAGSGAGSDSGKGACFACAAAPSFGSVEAPLSVSEWWVDSGDLEPRRRAPEGSSAPLRSAMNRRGVRASRSRGVIQRAQTRRAAS